MAFLHTTITGNTSFGGYLSIDGCKPFRIRGNTSYEVTADKHSFTLFSKSQASRGYAKF